MFSFYLFEKKKFCSAKVILMLGGILCFPSISREASPQDQNNSKKSSFSSFTIPEMRTINDQKNRSESYLPLQLSSFPLRTKTSEAKESKSVPVLFNPLDQVFPVSGSEADVIPDSSSKNLIVENKESSLNDETLYEALNTSLMEPGINKENNIPLSTQSALPSYSYSQSPNPSFASYFSSFRSSFSSPDHFPPNRESNSSISQASGKDFPNNVKISDIGEKGNSKGRKVIKNNKSSFGRKIVPKPKHNFQSKSQIENELLDSNENNNNDITIDLNSHKSYSKSPLIHKVNNELEDPFLVTMAEILSKNLTERISEIISLRNKPQKFLAILKAAQQSDNFEDPFTILRESSFDNLLATDSSSFSEGQKKLYQSSFRGISNEPKRYKARKKDANKNNTISNESKVADNLIQVKENSSNVSENNVPEKKPLHFDLMGVNRIFKNTFTNEAQDISLSDTQTPSAFRNKIIYEEISGNLHIDTSIDDIKDDYESQMKPTENSDQYIPPVNISRTNILEPQIHESQRKPTENSDKYLLPANLSRTNFLDPPIHEPQKNRTENSHRYILPGNILEPQRHITKEDLLNDSIITPKTNLNLRSSISQIHFTSTTKPLTMTDDQSDDPPSVQFIEENAATNSTLNNSTLTKTSTVINNSTFYDTKRNVNQTSFSTLSTLPNVSHSSFVKNSNFRSAMRNSKDNESRKEPKNSARINRAKNESSDDKVDKYYSFFGYKEQADHETEDSSEVQLSVIDHNDMILSSQAERMLQVMNSSADPCENFYDYACGKWSDVYPLEDKALDNTFDRLREGLDEVLKLLLEEPLSEEDSKATRVAKTLYNGCMDEEQIESLGVAPLKVLLRQLGGWPVLEGNSWNETNFDWVELMAKLRNYNNDILLSEWVAADITNSSNHIIQLDQPELGLPGREYFISASDQNYRMAYMELMLKTCELLGANPETALEEMISTLQFEKQLAKILTPAEERRNLSAVHRRMTVRQLQEEIPQINWNKYLDIVTTSSDHEERYVIVFAIKYIQKLVSLIESTNKRTVSNYLMWRFVKNRMNNLGKKALEAKQNFIQILFGSKSQPERWLTCVSYVNGNLGYILGALFVKKYYPQSSKHDSEQMIELIRKSFVETIHEATWMDEATRLVAVKKVDAMVRNVGYPEYILNNTYMDSIYSHLNFNESDHFWNVIKMLQFHAQSTHDLLNKPVSRTEWTTTPAVVNAYYSRSKNMIMFPAGILQPPFYHPAFPRCLNFGGIGVVIGHEISHGFDDRGRQFDEFGNLQQWWTNDDVSHFYDRATCMLDQYSNYKVKSVGLKINAVNTLGENIADNAGLKIAYKAYQQWKTLNGGESIQLPKFNLTHDQLFFLNFGQIWCEVNSPEAMLTKIRGGQHSPNKYRVIGTLSNSVEFSEAFHCPSNSLMNPQEKCQVW